MRLSGQGDGRGGDTLSSHDDGRYHLRNIAYFRIATVHLTTRHTSEETSNQKYDETHDVPHKVGVEGKVGQNYACARKSSR